MAHFRHHIPGVDIFHGSPRGISQVGVSNPLAERVALLRGGASRTEIRTRPQTRAVTSMASVTAEDVGAAACSFLTPGSPQWTICMLGAGVLPGADDDAGVPGGGGDPDCPIPLIRDADGQCRQPGSPADIDVGGSMAGQAVMGRYGAALAPMSEMRLTRDCLPGMVLGDDNLCYNRRDLKNSERKWPRGTRPLGTPGEMAALRKAASFGRRMETTVKRMQKIGVLKKPASRKAAPRHRMIAPPPAITAVSVGE